MSNVKVNPNEKSWRDKKKPGLFARLFFCWLIPIFNKGNKTDLEENDLVPPKKFFFSENLGGKLERLWAEECKKANGIGKKPSILKCLWKLFWFRMLIPFLPASVALGLRTYQPVLFQKLLQYWTPNSTTTLQEATTYAASMVIVSFVTAYATHHSIVAQQQLGMMFRISTCSLMYRKMLRMSAKSLNSTAAGKVVNLMSNDVARFDLAFLFLHQVILLPFLLSYVIYMMYMRAGIASIIGITVMFIFMIPLQGVLSTLLRKARAQSAVRTDVRIKKMDEIINGIQVIKMYAWEEPFATVVSDTRKKEINAIKKTSIARLMALGFTIVTERTTMFLCILVYTMLGNTPTASMIYPLQQLFGIIQQGIGIYLPMSVAFLSEMIVSIRRVQEFLLMDERSDLALVNQTPSVNNIFKNSQERKEVESFKYTKRNSLYGLDNKGYHMTETLHGVQDFHIEVKEVTASWVDSDKPTIDNISFRIKPGKLCAVIGSVGAGKSSLLQLFLKELPVEKGSLKVNGSLSYAAQESWLFPSTVRENILFGLPYDAPKYKSVCKYCCLEKDFKQFQFGDQTLVGDRGVSLSGGQRARINLARAVYREAEIYLLDDPLSAVDANVGKKLFEGCISTYLHGKTRILVTHQIHYLKTADLIIVLNNGKIENMGTYEELVRSAKDFTLLLASLEEIDKDNESIHSGGKRPSMHRLESIKSLSDDGQEEEAQVMAPEERTKGRLKWSVMKAYWASSGFWAMTVALFFILLSQATATLIDYWISYWMNQIAAWEAEGGNTGEAGLNIQMGRFTSGQYLIVYGSLIIVLLLAVLSRSSIFVIMAMRSSKRLHDHMFGSMIKAVMKFFDTSSSGRILNRFSKDMGSVDELLPRSMLDTMQIYLTMISTLILNVIALPWTIISSVTLLIVNVLMLRLYLNTSQALKRIEGTTRSPVFGMISSSLNGISTIRSAHAQKRLISEFDDAQNLHSYAWYTYLGGGVAFGFFLDAICMIYISVIFATFLLVDFDGVIPIGNVGLAVSQSLILMLMVQFGARNNAEMLGHLTAVERILEYTKLEEEKNLQTGIISTPPNWPSAGKIVFNKVSMTYADDAPPVLKNLNFTIESGAKVGIVGRTGAGKSSLISALFRFAHIDGIISIDGVDTSLVAKQDLRQRISIIPQEPVLFQATIRYNLDPFNLASDDEIWRALESVELKESIPSLEFEVSEGGSNFSVGQRQLVCLARAVLRSNKILIMDEATANVDPQTDAFIQKTIRTQFRDCTVLTIAHRLNTIMDSDMVLVMDTGEAVEYDHPFLLLENENSKFSSMVKETGNRMFYQLKEVAREAYFRSNVQDAQKKDL